MGKITTSYGDNFSVVLLDDEPSAPQPVRQGGEPGFAPAGGFEVVQKTPPYGEGLAPSREDRRTMESTLAEFKEIHAEIGSKLPPGLLIRCVLNTTTLAAYFEVEAVGSDLPARTIQYTNRWRASRLKQHLKTIYGVETDFVGVEDKKYVSAVPEDHQMEFLPSAWGMTLDAEFKEKSKVGFAEEFAKVIVQDLVAELEFEVRWAITDPTVRLEVQSRVDGLFQRLGGESRHEMEKMLKKAQV